MASEAQPPTATDKLAPSSYLVYLANNRHADDITVRTFGDRIVGLSYTSSCDWQTTSAEPGEYAGIRPPLEIGRHPIIIAGEIRVGDSLYAEILATNRWTDSLGSIHQIDSASLIFDAQEIPADHLMLRSDIADVALRSPAQHTSSAVNPEYLIVTSRALAGSFEPLRQYRTALDVQTAVVAIEDVVAQNSGRDDAERLRNYLKSFYADGGKYLLLGGDASVVPIRYAYPYPTDITPDLHEQLVCDLYFADLTGEWDVDSDNVWGERYSDLPDVTPELFVGRLPVSSTEEISAYTAKLIRYETNPGNGDPSYLARTLFYSADQMRDYSGSGQHHMIALAYPSNFQIDTTTGVEALTGNDPNPSNIGPLELPLAVRAGYGIVNLIAHGRFDGIVFKSSGYNSFPKQYLLTCGYSSVQCAFDSLGQESSPSFYYSLACDNGGFDLDRPPFADAGTNMARLLLGSPRGAVGLVANSRWGWIGASYFLHRAFFDSLFAHPGDPAITAMYISQKQYWYYRDLVYGQLYFGDPLTRVYSAVPRRLTIDARDSSGYCIASVSSPSGRENGVVLTLSDSSGIRETQITAGNGTVRFPVELKLGRTYMITGSMPGSTTGYTSLTPSITLDVNDEQNELPSQFALYQNYPNPFNPSTVISFGLPKSSQVTLTILNTLGQVIAHPVTQTFPAGTHQIEWNGRNRQGEPVASGVYFYRLSCDDFTATRKLALVR